LYGFSFYLHWFIGPACDTIASIFDEQGNPAELTDDERKAYIPQTHTQSAREFG